MTKALQTGYAPTCVFRAKTDVTVGTLEIPMRTVALPFLLVLAVIGCTSHEGKVESKPEPTAKVTPSKPTTPEPIPETPPTPEAPKVALRGAIASVSLIQNCSDDEPQQPPPPAADKDAAVEPPADEGTAAAEQRIAPGASAKPGGGGGFHQPCTQSFMQLTLSHDAKEAQKIEIAAVRLTAEGTGTKLGPVPFRGPTRWDEAGRYVAWDQSIPAGQELKASYKLGDVDWYAIGKAVGNEDTYAPRYVLEVDVVIDGRTITLRSNGFQREHAHVIVT
jgi:type IV secretory pathway VirB10-like protein